MRLLALPFLVLIIAGCTAGVKKDTAAPGDKPADPVNLITQGEDPKVTLRVKLTEGWSGDFVTKKVTDYQDPQAGAYRVIENQTAKFKVSGVEEGILAVEGTTPSIDVKVEGNDHLQKQMDDLDKIRETAGLKARYDSQGRMLQADVSGTDPQGQPVSTTPGSTSSLGFQGILYPEEAIGPGAKWSSNLDFNKALQGRGNAVRVTGGNVPMVFELVSIDEAKNEAKITATLEASMTMTLTDKPGAPIAMKMKIVTDLTVALDTGIPMGSHSTAVSEALINGKKRTQNAVIDLTLKR